ncbi:MAG: hypothetical protein DRP35_05520 [Candidatus Zixiibacteriota bacterium]|nr:MAG: hypothetical protein DRP35_05520 [candidate division Zixibacteria bacterium]
MKLISFFFLLTISVAGVSQKAQIQGKVTDAKTGDPIPGANIFLEGTTIGGITDFDGNYIIANILPGVYTVSCSFISYKSGKKGNIALKASETKTIDFRLSEATISLKTVKITTKKSERTENAMVAMQKKSATVINGISAEQISKIGSGNAAEVLKKVTGVTVQNGKYVYVRGLSDRYTKTTLNGAEIPAMDPERNTVQMDLFPTSILENLIVHKTFSAELPGDFSGGLINIKTKNFPDRFTVGYYYALGYNPQSNLRKDYLTYESGKFDWLGIDDGSRQLPEISSGYIPERYEDNNLLDKITRSFSPAWIPTEKLSPLNQKVSFSIGNKKTLFGKDFGYMVGASYANDYNYTDNGFYGRYQLISAGDTGLSALSETYTYRNSSQEAIWSAMANFGLNLNSNNNISLTLLNSHRGEKNTAHYQYYDNLNNYGMTEERCYLGFNSRNFLTSQLAGYHHMGNLKNIKIRWLQSTAYTTQNEPDNRYLINSILVDENTGDTTYAVDKSIYDNPRRFYRNMYELSVFERIDFEMPYRYLGRPSKLKFGLNDNLKYRDYQQVKLLFTENITRKYDDIAAFFADSNISATQGIRVQGSPLDDKRNSYFGSQHILAGYVMTDWNVSDRLDALIGVRMEKTGMHTESYKQEEGTEVLSGDLNTLDLLPALNLTFTPVKKMKIRGAYSRTVARPSFREKTPLIIENKTGDIIVGNPELLNTNITNIDFRVEKYFKRGELISLGAFYKQFKDPIEKTFNTEAQNPELTWRNVPNATLYGLELEFSKKLNFVSLLKWFKFSGNLTYIMSEVKIDEKELAIKRYYDVNYPDHRQMVEQAPVVANATLSYENDSLKLDINLTYTYEGEKLVIVNPKGIPDIFEKPNHNLDFNIGKQLGKHYKLSFAVKNLLNNRTTYYYPYGVAGYLYEDFGWGRSFVLKFSYLVK